ncbi:hypothetical protein GCM10028819_31870 [Spirosoma humi]
MIAFLIALGTTLLWCFFDRPWKTKRSINKPVNYYQGVVQKNSVDTYKREFVKRQAEEGLRQRPLDRVYFSTPGRSYMRYIWKGRILTSDKTWPYPPNTP